MDGQKQFGPMAVGLAGFLAGISFAGLFGTILASGCLLWPRLDGQGVKLGDSTYRVEAIKAPAASGLLLRILAAILGSTGSFGQSLRRKLLNGNGLDRMRALAVQIREEGHAPLLYPVARLRAGGLGEHSRLAASAEPAAKRPGRYNSVLDYHEAFKSCRATPLGVLEAALAAVDSLPPELRVFRALAPREALRAQAEESGTRYRKGCPLSAFDGVPVALKDMVYTDGVNCTNGSDPALGTGTDAKDDTVVAKLRARGALVLGLTVMTEFGVTPLGYSLHARAPVNAYDGARYSGGSSSGSALGAALGIFPVALGFDGGGSIRIPAAMEGVFGMKCTFGRVAVDHFFSEFNVSSGPMAGSAVDLALFYQVVAEADPDHFFQKIYGSAPLPPPHCAGFNQYEDLRGLRLGIFDRWFDDCHPEVHTRAREALAFLQGLGAEAVPVEIPHLEIMALAHGTGISMDFTSSHEHLFFDHPGSLEPSTRLQLALGGSMSGVEFLAGCCVRGWAVDFLERLFQEKKLSGLLVPTLGTLPPLMPASARDTGESNTALVMELLRFIFLGNLCGMPCVSMPAGLSAEKLPIGVQFIAAPWDEHLCLRVANAMDIPRFRSRPPGFVDLLAAARA